MGSNLVLKLERCPPQQEAPYHRLGLVLSYRKRMQWAHRINLASLPSITGRHYLCSNYSFRTRNEDEQVTNSTKKDQKRAFCLTFDQVEKAIEVSNGNLHATCRLFQSADGAPVG